MFKKQNCIVQFNLNLNFQLVCKYKYFNSMERRISSTFSKRIFTVYLPDVKDDQWGSIKVSVKCCHTILGAK